MIKTYKLAVSVMEFYDNVDPYGCPSDMMEDAIKGTVDLLLSGCKSEIIDDIEHFDISEGDMYYDQMQEVLSALRAYEMPYLWFRETGKDEE